MEHMEHAGGHNTHLVEHVELRVSDPGHGHLQLRTHGRVGLGHEEQPAVRPSENKQ